MGYLIQLVLDTLLRSRFKATTIDVIFSTLSRRDKRRREQMHSVIRVPPLLQLKILSTNSLKLIFRVAKYFSVFLIFLFFRIYVVNYVVKVFKHSNLLQPLISSLLLIFQWELFPEMTNVFNLCNLSPTGRSAPKFISF